MSTLDIGTYGEELYEQVLPLHGPDPDGLARDYIGAITSQAIEIDTLARDDAQGRPGWGAILDVDNCPVKGLPWLAQIAGVELRTPKLITQQNRITTPYPSAGVTGVTTSGGSIGSVTNGLGVYGPYVVAADKTLFTDFTVAWNGSPSGTGIDPGDYGGATSILVDEAKKYTWAIDIIKPPDDVTDDVHVKILWFQTDGTFISETGEAVGAIAIRERVVIQATAPAGASQALAVVSIETADAEGGFMAEGALFESGWTGGAFYGASMTRPETDEEWAVYARDAIRRQGGKGRGTVDAILSATEDTLTGERRGRVLERVGGNAYALELVTRPSETPDPAATLAAAMTQKPAGMSLTHTLSEGVIIDEGTKSIDTATATIDTATITDVAD